VDRDDVVRALRERHDIPSKPYFPAVHLMSYYREHFGHREGEFPVCEDVAARSIALPFFPEMTEAQVQRVAAALADVLGQARP
jgi:perosamine synthetase